VEEAAQVWQFQGAYLVARGDSVLARGAVGCADRGANIPNRPDTKFLIGSMTKPFTAIAVLQLTDRGLIDLNATLDRYIDIYPAERAKRITVHDLLCHRSGIPDLINNREYAMKIHEHIEPEEIVAFFGNQPLEFEPGSRYTYSSSNYVLLGLIVEKVTGMPWAEYIDSAICQPSGMTNTGVFEDYAQREDFAKGYAPDRTGQLVEVPPINPSAGYAAGSLASTVDDLFKLNQALYSTELLPHVWIDSMLTPYSPTYGYGWLIDDFGGYRLTAHGGGVPGYVSTFQRWVDDRVCVVVLSNNVAVPTHAVANGLAALALGEVCDEPRVKTPITIDSAGLTQYEGRYKTTNGEIRTIELYRGNLMSQLGYGTGKPILPEGQDRFYFARDPMTTITFIRNSNGNITGHIVQQAFDFDTAWIVTD